MPPRPTRRRRVHRRRPHPAPVPETRPDASPPTPAPAGAAPGFGIIKRQKKRPSAERSAPRVDAHRGAAPAGSPPNAAASAPPAANASAAVSAPPTAAPPPAAASPPAAANGSAAPAEASPGDRVRVPAQPARPRPVGAPIPVGPPKRRPSGASPAVPQGAGAAPTPVAVGPAAQGAPSGGAADGQDVLARIDAVQQEVPKPEPVKKPLDPTVEMYLDPALISGPSSPVRERAEKSLDFLVEVEEFDPIRAREEMLAAQDGRAAPDATLALGTGLGAGPSVASREVPLAERGLTPPDSLVVDEGDPAAYEFLDGSAPPPRAEDSGDLLSIADRSGLQSVGGPRPQAGKSGVRQVDPEEAPAQSDRFLYLSVLLLVVVIVVLGFKMCDAMNRYPDADVAGGEAPAAPVEAPAVTE